MKVSGQTMATSSFEKMNVPLPQRRFSHRVNVSRARTGISRSGAMPASRLVRAARRRTLARALRAGAKRDARRSHVGSRPIV
ncbi:hypothetical protein EES42_06815 [Streptomyces sp. ADI95-17]|nr:hypothetical protein EES42_06815 [Streptomyces sp. ADI95-17]